MAAHACPLPPPAPPAAQPTHLRVLLAAAQAERAEVEADVAAQRHQLDTVATLLLEKRKELSFEEQKRVINEEGEGVRGWPGWCGRLVFRGCGGARGARGAGGAGEMQGRRGRRGCESVQGVQGCRGDAGARSATRGGGG